MRMKKLIVMAVFFIVIALIIVVVSIVLYANTVKMIWDNQDSTIFTSAPVVSTVEPQETEEDVFVPIDDNDFLVDDDFIFYLADPNIDALVSDTDDGSADALTVEFDGMIIRPGMKVSEIVDSSYWYTLRENDILQPDDAGYLVLNNDLWTSDEMQLNSEPTTHNGEIILWVHNYSDKPLAMRDCVIYKYKISYRGCSKICTERPQLNYLNKYSLGYKGAYPECDYSEQAADSDGAYVRHIFGSINECQVILDKSDSEGLFAITVTYNEYYGPDFGREDGDDNGG